MLSRASRSSVLQIVCPFAELIFERSSVATGNVRTAPLLNQIVLYERVHEIPVLIPLLVYLFFLLCVDFWIFLIRREHTGSLDKSYQLCSTFVVKLFDLRNLANRGYLESRRWPHRRTNQLIVQYAHVESTNNTNNTTCKQSAECFVHIHEHVLFFNGYEK